MSTPLKLSSVNSSTVTGLPRKGTGLPAERADANSRKLDSGKRRCSRHCINSTPTAPVAPTTATTGADEEGRPDCMLRLPNTDDLMKTIQPINAEAPLGLPGGASWIRCFSTYDQRATSTRAPPQGFFVIVRFFVVRNMSPTLPDAGRQVKGPYRTRTSKHRWIRGLLSKSVGSVFAEMSRTS